MTNKKMLKAIALRLLIGAPILAVVFALCFGLAYVGILAVTYPVAAAGVVSGFLAVVFSYVIGNTVIKEHRKRKRAKR